ncbi:MAG: glycosyltransferase family 4 protein [Candidatus Beckwithbacteria bacterium]
MKIAVLSFTSGQIDRGVETLVRELISRWEKDNQVELINAVHIDWQSLTKAWPLLKNLMMGRWHGEIFRETVKAIRKLKKFNPDVVMPVNGGWQSLLVRLYCWRYKKKMVIPGLAGLGWCDRWNLYMQPDVFVASTKRNAKWARRYNKRVRMEIIPHGVDLKRFKPEGKRREIDLKKPIILCVAGPDKYKRVEATIKAVAKLKRVSLLLVGGSEEMEKLGKTMLGKRFLRLRVGYKELDQVYRAADVFTMVSESSEEFGIVNLEALANGLPVVVTDDELRRELLGEFGIYVKDVWGEEYVEKLRQALKKRKGATLPEKWLEKFSWEGIARKYEEVFKSLI